MSTITRVQELYQQGGAAEVSRGVFRKFATDVAPWVWDVWYPIAGDEVSISLIGDDYRFAIDTAQELKRYKTLMGERAILEDLLEELESNDVFWDIGSNVGLYTVPAASRCETVAFDPIPANTQQVRKNLELNNLDADVRTTGLGSSRETTEIHMPNSAVGGGSSLAPAAGADTISVQIRSGDDLVARDSVPEPTVVKIDVEGAESMVLEGIEETLSNVRVVLVEMHKDQLESLGSSISEVLDKLVSAGFEVSRISNRHEDNYHVLGIAE